MSRTFILGLILAPLIGQAPSQKIFHVAPVRTDLQRFLTLHDSPSPGACVFIDGRAFLDKDDGFNKEGLDFRALKDAVGRFHPRTNPMLYHIYLDAGAQRKFQGLISRTLEIKGLQADFAKPRFAWNTMKNEWDRVAKLFAEKESLASEEVPAGTRTIKVYPVRTTLSRVLCRDADCVVDVTNIWTGAEPQTERDRFNKQAADLVARLQLPSKKKIQFRLRARDILDALSEDGEAAAHRRRDAIHDWFFALGKSMGFASCEVSIMNVSTR